MSGMSGRETSPAWNEGLTFFGKIVAGQSHEVTNVLNIINQLAGLQEDVLSAGERKGSIDTAKLGYICGRIGSQVERGEKIVRNINRFAHTADLPVVVFDVRETLDNIVFLAERWTRLKRAELVADFPRETTAIEASPFLFAHAVFLCVEALLLGTDQDQRIRVGYRLRNGAVEVEVSSATPAGSAPGGWEGIATLELLLREIGGELRARPGDGPENRFELIVRGRDRMAQGRPTSRALKKPCSRPDQDSSR